MASPNTTRDVLEMDGDRGIGIGASGGRHKFTACMSYTRRNRGAERTNRDVLDGSTSS